MSYRAMVKVRGERELVGNQLFFPSKKEAEQYCNDLSGRWMAVEQCVIKRSPKKASHRFRDGRTVDIER